MLSDPEENPRYIRTIREVGYVWIADVAVEEELFYASPPRPAVAEHAEEIAAEILSPRNGDTVPHANHVRGTISGLPPGYELWIVKEPHPGHYHPDRGPAHVAGHEFRAVTFVGARPAGADVGHHVLVHLVLCSHETGRRFDHYLDRAHRDKSWIGLDTLGDGRILASITLIRGDV